VTRARLTGGEPLLRRDLPELVRLLSRKEGLEDLAMTTNGVLLEDAARPLREAGLHRVTVSLDTLHASRFEALTRTNALDRVLRGIDAASAAGFEALKLDTVVIRGVNDDELIPLLDYARARDAEIRFIEYMDVGGATGWSPDKVFPRSEILRSLETHYGRDRSSRREERRAGERFRISDGTVFGSSPRRRPPSAAPATEAA
jgi:cyclic pyranopterin phosphate synthase